MASGAPKPSLPTFLDCPTTELPTLPSISLFPFSITYDGPVAHLSSFFAPRPSTPTKNADGTMEEHQEVGFRGRLMVSSKVELPQGYKGMVFKISKPLLPPPITTTFSGKEKEDRKPVVKKAKLNHGKPLMKGVRRSPRKKKVFVKYSLDSDEENDDDEHEGQKVEEDEEMSIATEQTVTAETDEQSAEAAMQDVTSSNAEQTVEVPQSQSTAPESFPSTPLTAATQSFADLDETPLAKEEIHLKPVAFFDSIDLWNPDTAVDKQSDVFVRAINEWTGIAAKVSGIIS